MIYDLSPFSQSPQNSQEPQNLPTQNSQNLEKSTSSCDP